MPLVAGIVRMLFAPNVSVDASAQRCLAASLVAI